LRCSPNADCDDWKRSDLHGIQLTVARTEQYLRVIMLFALAQDFRAPMQHDPPEAGPVFVVPIDHHCNRRVLDYVSQALEHGAGPAFRFFVDRDVERIATYREAHRHDMGNCASISGSKMGDPSIGQELARET
jgi:hypothetical protein